MYHVGPYAPPPKKQVLMMFLTIKKNLNYLDSHPELLSIKKNIEQEFLRK
jgi:hypothetical protein